MATRAASGFRRINEVTIERLRQQAARHGVSTEEEVRCILQAAVSGPERLGDLALETFRPSHGVDLELLHHGRHDPMDLGS